MDATITQVRAFLTVVRLKGFTAAARALHISQPALTVKGQQIEETLQLRLLDRDTHRVCLTPAGRELFPRRQHGYLAGAIATCLVVHSPTVGPLT